MIPAYWSALADHLWQSTVFAGVAIVLALALHRNRAQLRYWLWLVASVKFVVPFSLLISMGSLFEWRAAPAVAPPLASAMEQIAQPFAAGAIPSVNESAVAARTSFSPQLVMLAVWLAGIAFVLSRWYSRWRRIRTVIVSASPLAMESRIPILTAPSLIEPGVFGIFRPVLLLPQGIAERLAPSQLRAILAHEFCHLRRHDNLAAAIHMLVEAVFWFHPLVWWIGVKLIEERERACDEEVVRLGNEPQAYAEGILSVCKFYLESPLACASGVTGADLKKRIEAIMTNRAAHKLGAARKALLAAAGIAAIAGPVLFGVMRAQSKPEDLTFEVASIKPADPDSRNVQFGPTPGGGLTARNIDLRMLIAFAYDLPMSKGAGDRVIGGPGWLSSERFDVVAKAPGSDVPSQDLMKMTAADRKVLTDQVRKRLRALLADRFQLVVRQETKEMPIYALVLNKNGPKFKESAREGEGSTLRGERGQMIGENITMEFFANALTGPLGRPVTDRTGLKGRYDFRLEYEPDSAGGKGAGSGGDKLEAPSAPTPAGTSILAALQDQLGLRVESTRGPVPIVIIERVEKPSSN